MSETTIRWFGQKWSAPVCRDAPEVPTPIGEPCFRCAKPFVEGDRGITIPHVSMDAVTPKPWHLDCYIKSLMPCDGCEVCDPTSGAMSCHYKPYVDYSTPPPPKPLSKEARLVCSDCGGTGIIEVDATGALGYIVKKTCPCGAVKE
jgi:hypothetical protein